MARALTLEHQKIAKRVACFHLPTGKASFFFCFFLSMKRFHLESKFKMLLRALKIALRISTTSKHPHESQIRNQFTHHKRCLLISLKKKLFFRSNCIKLTNLIVEERQFSFEANLFNLLKLSRFFFKKPLKPFQELD